MSACNTRVDNTNTNLKGLFLCSRAAVGLMMAQGARSIVNIPSTSAQQGFIHAYSRRRGTDLTQRRLRCGRPST
jgi:NAD(P)-dependent dehydrogenase (short-subunit alcohol dehydrogenase family)